MSYACFCRPFSRPYHPSYRFSQQRLQDLAGQSTSFTAGQLQPALLCGESRGSARWLGNMGRARRLLPDQHMAAGQTGLHMRFLKACSRRHDGAVLLPEGLRWLVRRADA